MRCCNNNKGLPNSPFFRAAYEREKELKMNSMFDTYPLLPSAQAQATMTMQTRGSSKIPLNECTEFTMHVSQKTEFAVAKKKLIDYTEYRLRNYIDTVDDKQQKLVLTTMLADYLRGFIAVAWRRGQPVYLKVTKG